MNIRKLLLGLTSIIVLFTSIVIVKNHEFGAKSSDEQVTHRKVEKGILGALSFYDRLRVDPTTGEYLYQNYQSARKSVEGLQTSKALNVTWQEMGPSNVGGRTRALLIDKNNANVMYAGGVAGGLWKSTTGGQSWTKLQLSESIAVSCIAQGPNGEIYVGTGEGLAQPGGTNRNSGQYGSGVYKSTDGTTFTLLSSTNNGNWELVNRLAVDKNGKVYAATATNLYASSNGGTSWTSEKAGNSRDIKIVKNGTVAIANVGGTVYINSNTTNSTWTASGLPTTIIRAEVAIHDADYNYMYAMLVNSSGGMYGVYRSTDMGATWTQIGIGGSASFNVFGDNGQGWYDAAIMSKSDDPNTVYIGGISVWKGVKVADGLPFSWTQISSTSDFYANGDPNPHYVHADVHALLQSPSNSSTFYIGTDGGIFKTSNGGATFVSHNINYSVTQYYAVSPAPFDGAIGGTQDNSTPYVDGSGNSPTQGRVLYMGDGGWAAVSIFNNDLIFSTSQNGYVGRSKDNGETWQYPSSGSTGTTPEFYSSAMITAGVHQTSAFITPLILWETENFPNSIDSVNFIADRNYNSGETVYPKSKHNNNYPSQYVLTSALPKGDTIKVVDPVQSRFYLGGTGGVYMTKQAASFITTTPVWYKIASATQDIYGLKISVDGNVLYYWTDRTLYRVDNLLSAQDSSTAQVGGANYALNVTTLKTFAYSIGGVSVDPSDADRIVVSLGSFSSTGGAHIYLCNDASAATPTFTAKGGNLSSTLPVYACLIPIGHPDVVIIGTEFGMMATENINSANPTWSNLNSGIDEQVPIFMLAQQTKQLPWKMTVTMDGNNPVYSVYPGVYNYGVIYAATHGRGFFKSLSFVGIKDIENNNPTFKSEIDVYPNPSSDYTTFEFELGNSSNITLSIFDIRGKLVKNLSYGKQPIGTFKQTINVSDLKSGIYLAKIQSGSSSKVTKFIVK